MKPPYITRKKTGQSFTYYQDDQQITNPHELERLAKLAVPPAWNDVKIARRPGAKIQATGIDSAGRRQAIYSPSFRLRQDKQKFDRILRFAKHLPALRRQVEQDLRRKRLSKEKVLACIIRLIDEAYFRVGHENYAKEHQTYGVTTLRSKHLDIHTNYVVFDFIGKSGKEHIKKIQDPQLARILKQLDELPGYEIFRYQDADGTIHDLHADDVNQYIKQYMGEEFTAKDFRTWGGTLLAMSALLQEEMEEDGSTTAQKKRITAVVKRVAKRLGNTPAIARASYIDPRVWTIYEDGVSLRKLKGALERMKPKKYLSLDEQVVIRLLEA